MTIFTKQDGYRLQQQNYDLKAEIERLRAAISYALLRSPWDSEPTKAQTLKKLGEALLGADEQTTRETEEK